MAIYGNNAAARSFGKIKDLSWMTKPLGILKEGESMENIRLNDAAESLIRRLRRYKLAS